MPRNPTPHRSPPCHPARTTAETVTNMATGLIQGGRGGPEDELLDDGQEEVFSRFEVEQGRIEHHSGEEPGALSQPPPLPATSEGRSRRQGLV